MLIPGYFAAFSAFLLVAHLIIASKPVQQLLGRIFSSKGGDPDPSDAPPVEPSPEPPHAGIVSEVKAHIKSLGGSTIFLYKIVRLVGCLALVGLTIATVVRDEKGTAKADAIDVLKKHWGKKGKHARRNDGFTDREWLQVTLCLTYVSITSRTLPHNLTLSLNLIR